MYDPFHKLVLALTTAILLKDGATASVEPTPFEFEFSGGVPTKIHWSSDGGHTYDLLSSDNLNVWTPMDGFPKPGTGNLMEQSITPSAQQFFRMARATDLESFLLPEVAAYKATTGITAQAANEINNFLRLLRSAGVEPALFWVGGSRYNSINGSVVRAVIGGNGTVIGALGTQGERFQTFNGNAALRFPNPLKQASQTRIGYFAGATKDPTTGAGGLISGGEVSPQGPILGSNWGGGDFRVFNTAGQILSHSGWGGFANADAFLPYVGGAYDGYFSVLCGIGKSGGTKETPLRFPLPTSRFPNNEFVNPQDFTNLGAPYFSGKLHFAVVTASDLTDNRRVYEIISIPRRVGFGPYGTQTAVVFLGDSITIGYNPHVWNSDGMDPPHKAGGQWNRNSLGLETAIGEGNETQIQYFEKASKYALDGRTWDHVFLVCGSGGHYTIEPTHATQNPLTQEAKDSIDGWVRQAHDQITVPAAKLGATVVQMTYIYGCPQNNYPSKPAEIYREFSDYVTNKQRELALASGFLVFDVYQIPQLHEPIPAFYADAIHPNAAGYRLIAQEFAASIANPGSIAPRSLTRPSITGIAKVSMTLSVTNCVWDFAPSSYSYQWMRDATDIPAATSTTYQLQEADVDFHISCRITATNGSGSAERTSAHTVTAVP